MINLNVHVLQHVPFEGPASIAQWMNERGHNLSTTKLYLGEPLPALNAIDWLIVMGGPMNVGDSQQYPWLESELNFIQDAIKCEKCLLGVCLGAQLIAFALDAKVKENEYKEIGWFGIQRSLQVTETIFSDIWPESIDVFHWHGDTFELPPESQLLASSEACANQGFIFNDRVVGLQFHLEVTPDTVASLIENCTDELDDSDYVQSMPYLLSEEISFAEINQLLSKLLEKLEEQIYKK
jgi:GMP synthase (glutamine-hydrolysing)